jgi:hypothetical protein
MRSLEYKKRTSIFKDRNVSHGARRGKGKRMEIWSRKPKPALGFAGGVSRHRFQPVQLHPLRFNGIAVLSDYQR